MPVEIDSSANKTVMVALVGNSAVCLLKLALWRVSGSGSLFAEALHSLADVTNQALLMIGIRRSQKAADAAHPYGYGSEQFVWALISAVGVFFGGAGASVYHGVSTLMHPEQLMSLHWAFAGLGVSAVVESYTFWYALRQVRQRAKHENMSVYDYVTKGSEPMNVAVFLEDSAALVGLAIASVALLLTYVTGNPVYDSVGTIMVGALLGAVAVFLIRKNSALLLGKAMPARQRQTIEAILKANPAIRSVHDIKAVMVGPNNMRFKAEIDFDGSVLAQRVMTSLDMSSALDKAKTPEERAALLRSYGEEVIDSMGVEIDRIEQDIRSKVPEARHVDLEVH